MTRQSSSQSVYTRATRVGMDRSRFTHVGAKPHSVGTKLRSAADSRAHACDADAAGAVLWSAADDGAAVFKDLAAVGRSALRTSDARSLVRRTLEGTGNLRAAQRAIVAAASIAAVRIGNIGSARRIRNVAHLACRASGRTRIRKRDARSEARPRALEVVRIAAAPAVGEELTRARFGMERPARNRGVAVANLGWEGARGRCRCIGQDGTRVAWRRVRICRRSIRLGEVEVLSTRARRESNDASEGHRAQRRHEREAFWEKGASSGRQRGDASSPLRESATQRSPRPPPQHKRLGGAIADRRRGSEDACVTSGAR
jgi:hypothetical protein